MNSSPLNYLRRYAFWALDLMKGGEIRKHFNDIQETLEKNSFDSLKEKINSPLSDLLKKATNHSNFYTDFKHCKSLKDFPVINKNIIKENFENLLIKTSSKEKHHKMFTSGSTGIPFMVYQNQGKKNRNTADTIYFAAQAGYTLGDKLLYVRLWNENLKKRKIPAFLQNIVQVNIDDLKKEDYIKNLLKKLQKDPSPKAWLGYPSGLEKICDYLDKINSRPLDCNVQSIIGMSESLSDHVRSKMWYYFNTPMVSRYSNFENGIIAQQPADGDFFVVNWASYILEILDFNTDEPAKEGQLGRIVITDLYNHATPMIRYDTGDVGALTKIPSYPFPVLKSVEGRKADILMDTQGNMTSPYKYMSILPAFPELKQVQFVQNEKNRYTIKLNVDNTFNREAELVRSFKGIIGKNARVTVDYVNEIPLLNSKKRKITRNLYLENTRETQNEKSLTH
ncbi:CoF synthetase [Muricauda sp. JGD-17]|uniref:CoF synthetase n=1 Tax=Flagellimonas ochracea TaxID=2696472 RepID=A0A964TAG8_9FLAO|nr:phenylacetate--CoA ligase family protein [Allomuricauda ochracea]NAY91247.1 CoF synthetase [Allomuricauda ochracea]